LEQIAIDNSYVDGHSEVEWSEYGYPDLAKNRRSRAGADADQPYRIKYRRMHTT